jgi:hypothetical protein
MLSGRSAIVAFQRLLILAALAAIPTRPLAVRAAEMSAAERYAADGGQTLGAANACGFDPEEIVIATKQVMDAARKRAAKVEERDAVQPSFVEGFKSGVEALRSGQTTCIDTRDQLTKIEDGAVRQ